MAEPLAFQAERSSLQFGKRLHCTKSEIPKRPCAHGGVRFARSLVAHGLVDQFILLIHPIVLGQGRPLFSELATPLALRRVETKAFPGGAVAQVYRTADR